MADFDLVIRGGTVVDGTGAAPFLADVAVSGGLIVQVGRVTGSGREEIDAAGKAVTPGFVDVHTHYDGQITWENTLAPSSNHGVTTVVMGNCGVGFAPARSTDHELVIKLMEGVEDIPEVVMAKGVPWNWESFTDYLDALDTRPSDIDFAAQLPHSPLRVYVMGERGGSEPPTEQDLAEMRRLVSEAVRAGALGVSTSRNLFHRFRSGVLAPSVKTEKDELLALAGGLKDAGAGVFQLNPHLDGEAPVELALFEDIAASCGRPLNFSLINVPGKRANWDAYVEGLSAARAKGLTIRAQFLPRPIGVLLGLDLSFNSFSLNPSYREISDLPLDQKVARMKDPEFRARLLAEQPDDPNPAFVGLVNSSLDGRMHLYPLADPANYHPATEEMLAAKAERLGVPLREVIYDELLKDEGRAILCGISSEPQEYVQRTASLVNNPNAVVALGDGGAHYAMVCDAAYTTYMLTQRVGHHGLDLQTVVKSLTSQPANSLGLNDRGVVGVGYKADLNVLDMDRLKLYRPAIRVDLPAGGKRLSQRSEGYVATIVSGIITRRDDKPTGALPGRLVRGAQDAPMQGRSSVEA